MMIRELILKLKDNVEYFDYHNKNLTKEQDKRLMAIKAILEGLQTSNVYHEVAMYNIEDAIDEFINEDETISDEQLAELENLTEEDKNDMSWQLDNCYAWDDLYGRAKSILSKRIGCDNYDEY